MDVTFSFWGFWGICVGFMLMDAAYKSVAKTNKAYFVWFREHGYEPDQIEEWYKD